MGDCSSSICVLTVGTSSASPSLTHEEADYYIVCLCDQTFARLGRQWQAAATEDKPSRVRYRPLSHGDDMTRRLGVAAGLIVLVGSLGGHAQQAARPFVPVTDEMLLKPDPADWLMWRRTLDSWGYSPLDQINRSNVARLKMVWTRGMGPGTIQEATPLVYRGVMYLPSPSDLIQALDAQTGELLWEYKRKLPADLSKFMPAPSINRNLAIYGNTIIDTSCRRLRLRARRARPAKLAWETQDPRLSAGAAQQTSGPIIANGKIFSGRGCEPEGGPDACVVTAHDARTGKELWRTRTIPGAGRARRRDLGRRADGQARSTSAPGWCRATTRC